MSFPDDAVQVPVPDLVFPAAVGRRVEAERARGARARTFHTLLATGATLCPKYLTAFAALEDVRAKIKTAWRFCFSPHEREGADVRPPHRRQAPGQYRGKGEKCGLALVDRLSRVIAA